jgi:hypothetical protein
MNPKHHTSLKIAKQLAEAGIVIESEYVWQKWNNAEDWVIRRPIQRGKTVPEIFQEIPAPIATELLEEFKKSELDCGLNENYAYANYPFQNGDEIRQESDTVPNALALLLIRLTKDGLI